MVRKFIATLLFTSALTACAEGPSFQEKSASIAPLEKGMSRIFVYRLPHFYQAALQPPVKIENARTGNCQLNSVFYIDVPRGKYVLSATTENTSEVAIDTTKDNITYIRCSVLPGIVIGRARVFEVAPDIGAAEIQKLVLTGAFKPEDVFATPQELPEEEISGPPPHI